jgi:hypothetical protein
VEDDLADGVGRLAARSDRTVAAEVRQALRFWVDSNGGRLDDGGVSIDVTPPSSSLLRGLNGGGALPAVPSPLSPPPVLPLVKGKQRTEICEHRRPVSSFCRYCDV